MRIRADVVTGPHFATPPSSPLHQPIDHVYHQPSRAGGWRGTFETPPRCRGYAQPIPMGGGPASLCVGSKVPCEGPSQPGGLLLPECGAVFSKGLRSLSMPTTVMHHRGSGSSRTVGSRFGGPTGSASAQRVMGDVRSREVQRCLEIIKWCRAAGGCSCGGGFIVGALISCRISRPEGRSEGLAG